MRKASMIACLTLIVLIAGLFAFPSNAEAEPSPNIPIIVWAWMDPCGGYYYDTDYSNHDDNKDQWQWCLDYDNGGVCAAENYYILIPYCEGRGQAYMTPIGTMLIDLDELNCYNEISGQVVYDPAGQSYCTFTACDNGC